MLVIRRRAGERITIGDSIEIEILEITSTRVKIGIIAPGHIPIVRQEVRLTREQNVSAAQPVTPDTLSWLAQRLLCPIKRRGGSARQEFDGPV